MNVDNESSLPDGLFINTPELPWCFDILLFYKSEDDEQARNVLVQLETYSRFSFAVNGIITSCLAIFGLLGNLMFIYQIHKSCYFSRRLACHLTMLCVWDIALLMCCIFTYSITSLYYEIIPIVGIVAYLLYFFQPFASFCVLSSIWQVLAITVERYTAVSKPLELRTRNAQFSVRAICAVIALGSLLLNMVVVPFERKFIDCYEFTQNGFDSNTMLTQEEIVNNQYYAILVHLIPDIIFRAPTPIVLIAILTVRTIQICSRRTVGSQIIQTRRNVPYMLTVLNIKFVMCNTLYLFNTILMEVLGYGGKTSSQQTELEMEQYIRSLYLTDFSNMLLAVHSASNWLIFYHWPSFKNHKKYSTLTVTNSSTNSKTVAIDQNAAELLLSKFSAHKYKISTDVLLALCNDSPLMAAQLMGKEIQTPSNEDKPIEFGPMCRAVQIERQQQQKAELHKHAVILANVIEEVLFALTSKGFSIMEWRELCRSIGYRYHEVNVYCGVDQWKLVRDVLVASMNSGTKWYGTKVHQVGAVNLQKTMMKVFNYALREMKSGALCALVDTSQQQVRASRLHESSLKSKFSKISFVGSGAVSCNIAVNVETFQSTNLPNLPKRHSSKNSVLRSKLRAVDSFGNSSLDSILLDLPSVRSSQSLLSKFNYVLNSKSSAQNETRIKKPLTLDS